MRHVQLVRDAERLTLEWAKDCDPKLHATLLRAKELIPAELLIGGTFWSALTMVGDLEDGCNHLHVDGHDVVSLIIQVGPDVKSGGATVYYETYWRSTLMRREMLAVYTSLQSGQNP